MAVFNGETYIQSAIESILGQTFKDFEFIIVDDGSTDNTLEIVRNFVFRDNRIKIIQNNCNLGLTKSLNKALKNCIGEYIIRQDADDKSLPTRLEKLLEFLDNNPDYAFCGSDGFLKQNINHTFVNSFEFDQIKNELVIENCFLHPSIIIRKETFQKYGYYDETYLYGQDYELWCRLIFKYKLKAFNMREKLVLINLPPKKKKIKIITQRINSIRTKLKYIKYMPYKFKCLISIIIRLVETLTFNKLMNYFSKILKYIKF